MSDGCPQAISTQRSSCIRTSIYTVLMEAVLVRRHRTHWAKNQSYKQLSDWLHITSHPLASCHPCNPLLCSSALLYTHSHYSQSFWPWFAQSSSPLPRSRSTSICGAYVHAHPSPPLRSLLCICKFFSTGSHPRNSVLLSKFQLGSNLPTHEQHLKSL